MTVFDTIFIIEHFKRWGNRISGATCGTDDSVLANAVIIDPINDVFDIAASWGGVQVVDVADPAHPVLHASVATSSSGPHQLAEQLSAREQEVLVLLPTHLSTSTLSVGSILFSLGGFIVFYTGLFIAEMYLMLKYARLGPSSLGTGKYHLERQGA